MGFFNDPGPCVTKEEFERVLNTWHARNFNIPHKDFEIIRQAAEPYLQNQVRQYRGIDAKELPKLMEQIRFFLKNAHSRFIHDVDELEEELEKAVKEQNYGRPFGL